MTIAADALGDVPSPFRAGEAAQWDTLTVNGRSFLGKVEVSGSRGKRLEQGKARGRRGARLTDNGEDPWTGLLTLSVWDDEGWSSLVPILEEFEWTRTTAEASVVVEHPVFSLAKVASVVAKTISDPEGEAGGVLKIKIELVEAADVRSRAGASRTVQPTRAIADLPVAFTGLEAAPVAGRPPAPVQSPGNTNP